MKLALIPAAFVLFSLSLCGLLNAESPKPADDGLAASKILGWTMASQAIEILEAGDSQQNIPGTEAWLKDFHKQTKGIDEKIPPEKWPAFDVDVLVTHNPRFWQMCYEIAPADPGMAILHSGLLITGGEAKRAYHVLQVMCYRPNLSEDDRKMLEYIMNTALGAGKQYRVVVEEGIKFHDAGEYDKAINKYEEAIAAWPQNGWAYYELGFSHFTKLEAAGGNKAKPDGVYLHTDKEAKDSKTKALIETPVVFQAYSKARRHDPFQVNAYQGTDQDVIRGFMAMQKKILPAIKKLNTDLELEDMYKNLTELAEGFQEASQHELALLARQSLVACRGRYEPADHPFITMSLRKIAPGPEAEETLKRLNGPGEIKFKQLIAVEMPRVYFPDLPAKQEAESKKVKLDHIQMLTDDEIIATRTSAEEMGNFINKAKKIAFDILEKSDKPFKVRVQFKCTPDGHKVEIAVNKEPDEHKEFLNKLHEELPKLEKLPVKEGTVEFQMFFEVNRQQKKEESKEE